MLSRLRKNLVEANYGALCLEILVVILGILIALQIDGWAQERRDRQQERQYLQRLTEDLEFEIDRLTEAIGFAERRIAAVRFLEQAVADPAIVVASPVEVARALDRATWRSFPVISAFVYTELQSTGNLALIRSESLRLQLAEYYASLQRQARIGQDLDLLRLFDRATAGILSTEELLSIEQRGTDNLKQLVGRDRALEIADEFAARPDAAALLPDIAQHHAFNKRASEASREDARRIIAMIDSLTGGTAE